MIEKLDESYKLTNWFTGTINPVNVGVYEKEVNGYLYYAYWNGNYWGMYSYRAEDAEVYKHDRSYDQHSKWRGLLKE